MGGRPSIFPKNRKAIVSRVPDEIYDRVAADTAAERLTQGDIVAHILSLHYDLPECDPITIKREHAKKIARDREVRRQTDKAQMLMTG
jgi:hypothetical protein